MKEIWIVDDDEEMTKAMQLMLKLLGYETACYLSPRPAAKALLSNQRPDLLLLDINMPGGVSGLDMLEFVRRRADLKNLPVVMLSTEAADVTVDRAMELGADTYVSKPVTIEELEAALELAFQKHPR